MSAHRLPSGMGIRARLVLLLAAAFALLAAALGWDCYRERRDHIEAAKVQLLGELRLISARHEALLERADALLDDMMLSPESSSPGADEACTRRLVTLMAHETAYLQIGKAWPNGTVACAAVSSAAPVNVADRAWFEQTLKTHETVLGDVIVSKIVKLPVIPISKAKWDDHGHVSAVFFVALGLGWMNRSLTTLALPPDVRLSVIDGQGFVVARYPDPEHLAGRNASESMVVMQALAASGSQTWEGRNILGQVRLIAHVPLLTTHTGGKYHLILSIPKESVEAPAQRDALIKFTVLLAVLLATLTALVLAVNRLLSPLVRLSGTVARYKAGDLTARSDVETRDDEVAALARAFDEAASVIEDRERRLAYANRALRVLSASNRTLLHGHDEQQMLAQMCEAIVAAGEFRIAWIGYAESDGHVRVMASSGAAEELLARLHVTWDESPDGLGPVGRAIRGQVAIAWNSAGDDPRDDVWRDGAIARGCRATLSLPIRLVDDVIGILNICAAEEDMFDATVIEVLDEATHDLAMGIRFARAEVDRKRGEEALLQAHDRLALAQRAAGACHWDWDILTGAHVWADEFYRLYGLDPLTSNASWETWLAAVHPLDRDAVQAQTRAAERDRVALHMQFRVVWPTGEFRWIEAFGDTTCNARGDPLRFSGICLDVTERRNVDQELRRHRAHLEELVAARTAALAVALDAAKDATRSKAAFLANMSHEIRTPMNAIIGLTHLMARDTRDARQRDRLGKVDGAAKHLLQVINDILDLSKIDAGKMLLEDIEFSRDALLAGAFEMVSAEAAAKGIELILDTDHLPERLRGDPKRLAQCLINLLANAVKFTERGWIRLRAELLAENGERLQLRFEVKDSGIGIAPERQSALFNAFEQADTSTTRRHGGTGLGLSLTRHFANLMGGDVGFDSASGEGSTFWFTAWVHRAAEAGDRARHPVAVAGLRALLVDDLPESLSAISEALIGLGLHVEGRAGGVAALESARSEWESGRPFDVVLLDWQMDGMDGVATLTELRRLLGHGMPPCILVTAYDETGMWQQAREARFDAMLVKPITASALHDALVRVFQGPHSDVPASPLPEGQGQREIQRLHGGGRILLAEDNPINQEVACELLASVGLIVDVADEGAKAVKLALERSYDLILMDVQMPGMDGLEATRRIRARLGNGLPIIAMTANAFKEDREACLAAGMNDHVAKPVDPDLLFDTVFRWLPRTGSKPEGIPENVEVALSKQAPALPLAIRLAAVTGLDAARALRNVAGRPEILDRVLRSFVNTYGGGADGFRVSPVPGHPNAHASMEACHSLRGACSAIGATLLASQLEIFELPLKDGGASGEPGLPDTEPIRAQLQTLVKQLRVALNA